MHRVRILVFGGLVFTAAGCPEKPRPSILDAATEIVDAGAPDAGPIDAGPPLPAQLRLTIDARFADGGAARVEPIDGTAEIDPLIGLDVAIPIRLKDFRLRVLDWADQVVPSDDTADVTDAGIEYRIDLQAPLKTGRSYVLAIDSQFGPVVADEAGRTWEDIRLKLKVRGEVEPDPKKPGKPKKKKK